MFYKIPPTVKRVLLDCPGLNTSTIIFYEVTSVKDLCTKIMPEKVLLLFIICNLKKSYII